MKKLSSFVLLLVLVVASASAATPPSLRWTRPPSIQGIAQPDPAHPFWRLPAAFEHRVRPAVWQLSLDTAGEFVHFRTDANEIHVRYRLGSTDLAMPHMPATGVSGVDLFARDENGEWNWVRGDYRFGATTEFVFKPSAVAHANAPVDFYLYLPLYNAVQDLDIGVPAKASLAFPPPPAERPIVAYGTSIMQGAVASRPGLAWTSMLSRALDRTVINLGFSGNGTYEEPIFEVMANTPARLFVLDCMPNLLDLGQDELQARLEKGLTLLHAKQPGVPVLLAEYPNGQVPFFADGAQKASYHQASLRMAAVFDALRKKGFDHLYLLSESDVPLTIDSTTEGTHPNDIGMMQYARAYEDKIRTILDEPTGTARTLQARRQYRDDYDWGGRHEAVKRRLAESPATNLLVGDSIIHFFGGAPADRIARGNAAWQRYMLPLKVQNAGFGWDRIENVRWRLFHGEFDAFKGHDIILMIGTNNLQMDSDQDIVTGLQSLALQFRQRFPTQTVVLGGILPRRGMEERVRRINQALAAMAARQGLVFRDVGAGFLSGGKIEPSLFQPDGLHPSPAGYTVLGKALSGVFKHG